MKGYIKKALQRFERSPPTHIKNAPSRWTPPDYGAKQQYSEEPDLTPPLDKQDIKGLQAIIGTFLFYARAVDSMMLVALGTLTASQTNGTQATLDAAIKLLNYAASHPDAKVRFHTSKMQLHIHSDASYLSEPKARSRSGGYYFLDGWKGQSRP